MLSCNICRASKPWNILETKFVFSKDKTLLLENKPPIEYLSGARPNIRKEEMSLTVLAKKVFCLKLYYTELPCILGTKLFKP